MLGSKQLYNTGLRHSLLDISSLIVYICVAGQMRFQAKRVSPENIRQTRLA